MAQVEDPASLGRWDNPAYQLITLILIRCGLRVSDALDLPGRLPGHDGRRRPLPALLQPQDETRGAGPHRRGTRCPHQANSSSASSNAGRPGPGTCSRGPTPTSTGTRPVTTGTYRDTLSRWLDACDVRDEYGQPVHLTPHQWRHTLGTRLINRDVPQHVVQKILDHDSPQMTAHYARLSTRPSAALGASPQGQHHRPARPSAPTGRSATPPGPSTGARATQALPNGYCGLPVQKTCPHANACLTCPMFLTTAEFLPQHRAQRSTLSSSPPPRPAAKPASPR